jgi:uncharacterized protein (TIGR03435 family)
MTRMKFWTMLLLTLTGVGAAAPFDSLSLAQGGQTATTANVRFEVASIKENKSGSQNSSSRTAGERYSGTNVSLIGLLRTAYAVQEFQIAGYPAWAETDKFDVEAKIESGANLSDFPLMLQKLLAERFKLVVHRELRQAPIYALVVMKDGPKFKPGDPAKCGGRSGGFAATPTEINGGCVTMEQFAARLSRSIGTHVVDETSLKGTFDFKVSWLPDDRFSGRGASANPTLFTAIQEQLGLRLQSGRGPVDSLVIDRAEKPVTD